MEKQFSIQFVSKITGINSHTIRAWEKRYSAIKPARDANGRRLYSESNINRLQKLHHLVSMGNNISDIAYLADENLDQLYQDYAETNQGDLNQRSTVENSKEPVDVNLILQNLVLALNHYKLDIISHELEKIKKTLGPREFALNILAPLLTEVGAQVEAGNLTIAQEHSISAILKFHIGHMLYLFYETKKRNDLNVVISTPEGELHEFGIMIAALLCSHYRLNFYYLGPNMPAASLREASKQINGDVIIVGVSRHYTIDTRHDINQYISDLLEDLPPQMKVLLGGSSKLSNTLKGQQVQVISTLQMLDHQLSKL